MARFLFLSLKRTFLASSGHRGIDENIWEWMKKQTIQNLKQLRMPLKECVIRIWTLYDWKRNQSHRTRTDVHLTKDQARIPIYCPTWLRMGAILLVTSTKNCFKFSAFRVKLKIDGGWRSGVSTSKWKRKNSHMLWDRIKQLINSPSRPIFRVNKQGECCQICGPYYFVIHHPCQVMSCN